MKKSLLFTFVAIFLVFSFGYVGTNLSFANSPDKQFETTDNDKEFETTNNDKQFETEDNDENTGARAIRNPIKVNSIQDFIAEILKFIVKIGVPIVAFFIILSGFNLVTAQGNERQLETAKRGILYTIIGGILLLGAWGLAQVIGDTVDKIVN